MSKTFFKNSLWLNNNYNFDKLSIREVKDRTINVDVCIVGAGIFGLTCSYYLSNLGYKVVVLEKDEIGHKATGHTTAKITSQHGLFYDYLLNANGEQFAKDYLEINQKAIGNIKEIIDKELINCDFEWQNNFVYTTKKEEVVKIKKEYEVTQMLGMKSEFITETDLPFKIESAICFKEQAQFNPLKYLYGLSRSINSMGGIIFTDTTVFNLKQKGSGYVINSTKIDVNSNYVIIASHYPFINFPGFYFTKMYQSTSYIIAVNTHKRLFTGMYLDNSKPFFSYRVAKKDDKNLLLIGGGDHKTGQPTDYENSYGVLERKARELYPDCEVLYKWNTRDCISLDKIPYIGQYSVSLPNVYVGTGFKKWGMTSSNVAANIIVDAICGKKNKYAYVFNSIRLKPLKNADEMKNLLIQSANSLIIDKLKDSQIYFENIKKNSGSIIDVNNQKVGIYKNSEGKIYAVKPICSHLGCLLSWNDVDKTWDCPCHGSRFMYNGKNIYDPAFKDLEIYNID